MRISDIVSSDLSTHLWRPENESSTRLLGYLPIKTSARERWVFGAELRRRVALTSYVIHDAGGYVWYISTPEWSKGGITGYPKLPNLKICQY